MNSHYKTTDLIAKAYSLSQVSQIDPATRSDFIFRSFCEEQVFSANTTNLWEVIGDKIDAVFGADSIKKTLRKGPLGLELALKWMVKVCEHPKWDEDSDSLLAIQLERVIKELEASGAKLDSPALLRTLGPRVTLPKTNKTNKGSKRTVSAMIESSPANQSTRVSKKKAIDKDAENILIEGNETNGRSNHDVGFKVKVIHWHKKNGCTQADTANHFNITQTSLSRWLKEQDKLEASLSINGSQVRRHRTPAYPKLEDALFHWIVEARARQVTVSDSVIRLKAQQLGLLFGVDKKMNYSVGWVDKFKKRHHLRGFRQHGEAASVDPVSAEKAREDLRKITAEYNPSDIFNADETGLLYKSPPNTTLATTQTPGIKGNKARITYLFCCNANGSEKLNPLIIGSSEKPKPFGSKKASFWGFDYYWNKKAWMTGVIFAKWLRSIDHHFQEQGRKILLLLDNFSGHTVAVNSTELTNVRVHFLPPNMTSVLQPCDAGIIRAWKAHYRRLMIEKTIQRYEDNPDWTAKEIYNINLLEAMFMAQEAWDFITSQTLTNCWRHTGIVLALSSLGVASKETDHGYAPDPELREAVEACDRELQRLNDCPGLEESRGSSRISIEQLLNPLVESQPPEAETDMPTLQEIVEMVSPDQSNTDHADSEEEVERVPWSMNECRKAIDELSYAFNYRKSDDPEEPNWAPHIRYLANIMEDVNHVKRQSMKQKSITDFFRREKSPIEIQDSDSD